MMKRHQIAILAAGLLATNALAQAPDDNEWSGSVTLGARKVAPTANDPSKLNEYRDLQEDWQAIGAFEARQRGEQSYFNAYGENIGRDDQYFDLNGGRYGVLKYRVYLDDLRHNFGSGPGARSPYAGIGTSTITATLPNANVATWNQFDHSYKRRDLGAMLELQAASRWYVRSEFNQVTRNGINVFAGANGTSPGNGFMDLPAPIDYTTRNYLAEGGFTGARSHFAVNFLHTRFDNGNDVLRWSNGVFGGLDTTVLPADNQMWRIGANGNIRKLPLDSTLAGRFTYSRLTNDVAVQQTMLSTGATNPATNPNETNFRGDLRKTTMGLSLVSHPLDRLDTKLYWNYLRDDNHSTDMTFNPAVGSGLRLGTANAAVNCANNAAALCSADLFHLKRHNFGVEAGYRPTRANKLSGGLDYAHIDRERVDFPKTNETRWYAEWKNSSLDWLSSRLKYQRLTRTSTFDLDQSAFAANPMDAYVRRYDFANVTQNLYKLVLDVTPLPLLDFGFEASFKRNDYRNTILGRRDDSRQEYYASVGYGNPASFRVLVFGDIEFVKFDSNHRVGTGAADPNTAPTATTYNWNAINKDRSWQVGIGTDWVLRSHLTVKSSFIYAETRGTADFMVQPGGSGALFPAITNFDNTRRTTFTLRGIYEYSKEWEFTAGYAWERYRYSDIGYDNTAYVTSAAATAGSTTGQFAFQPYTANIVYGLAKYRF
jgi:MtrB/PioB family decaheme-associated outer membrane protein